MARTFAKQDGCGGALQAHHVVPRQRIRLAREAALIAIATGRDVSFGRRRLANSPLEELIADGRNGVMICELHHSQPFNIPSPSWVEEFREEYDL